MKYLMLGATAFLFYAAFMAGVDDGMDRVTKTHQPKTWHVVRNDN